MSVTRKTVLFVFIASALLVGSSLSVSEEKSRKNVLFIVSDDLNCYIGAYGDPHAKTPNMDRLAERGTLFTKAMCQFPVCGPSRVSFMTGLRPNTTGIFSNGPSIYKMNPDVKSIPNEFRKNGYVTARTGKIYNGVDNSEKRDWDFLIDGGANARKVPHELGEVVDGGHVHWRFEWRAPDCEDHQLPDGANTDAAIQWLTKNKNQNFFLAVGFQLPHLPLISPKKYYDMHDRDALSRTWAMYKNEEIPVNSLCISGRKIEDVITEEQRINYVWAYYAALSYIDAQLGKLLDALDDLGVAENTVIVLFGDNGYHVGEHQSWGKNTLFESGARVPLMIADPNAKKGIQVNDVVELVDLFPTLLELCDLDLFPELEGRSLVSLLNGTKEDSSPVGFTQVAAGWSVRTDRWRLMNINPKRRELLLYDMENDPQELKNLADNPERATLIQNLFKQAAPFGFK